jgi:hypothetical protein
MSSYDITVPQWSVAVCKVNYYKSANKKITLPTLEAHAAVGELSFDTIQRIGLKAKACEEEY